MCMVFQPQRIQKKPLTHYTLNFYFQSLRKCRLSPNFISWIERLLKKKESFNCNGGITAQFFKLRRNARQRDPISAYLFILANPCINGLNIFDHCYLYLASADVTTFKDIRSRFYIFSCFSGLKPNLSKCETADIGVLLKVAACGLQ